MSNGHSLPDTRGEPPILHKSYTSFGANIDLTAESGYPPHAAQHLIVHNDEATVQAIVLTDIKGNSASYPIQADTVEQIAGAFTSIVASGTGTIAKVVARWWQGPGYRLNP